jgi:hypothetical protein
MGSAVSCDQEKEVDQGGFTTQIMILNLGKAALHWGDTIIVRAVCVACTATWKLGANSAFALGPRKTTEIP